jgi:hypothetical protein
MSNLEGRVALVTGAGAGLGQYFYPIIDGCASHVGGVYTPVTGWPLRGFDFKSMWVS